MDGAIDTGVTGGDTGVTMGDTSTGGDSGPGGDSSTTGNVDAAGHYTVGGTVSGLAAGATVVLVDKGTDPLTVAADGSFTFATALAGGSMYKVTVQTQPASPMQTCTVTNGTGIVSADVTNVAVACTTNSFDVGGTVSGLGASAMVTLQDNGGDNTAVTANGTFTFATPVPSGMPYAVTVLTQPPGQTCSVVNGSGTVMSAAITSVQITCSSNTYTIGGTLSGLPAGSTVTLQNNAGDSLPLNANGAFMFGTGLMTGQMYAVTVSSQPAGAICNVSAGTGTVAGANVTQVVINCSMGTYTIGGTVAGLAGGDTLILENNGMTSTQIFVSMNGAFSFATPAATGAMYAVTVASNPQTPVGQTCTLTGATGTVGSANVTTIGVTCTTNVYTVGGTISGLGSGTVVLQNNLGSNLPVTAGTMFTFTAVPSGSSYNVTVQTQPGAPSETCTVSGGSGSITNANVTNVNISCVASPIGSFNVGNGPSWATDPQSVSCVQECANLFGGSSNQYGCSLTNAALTHQAYGSEWGISGCPIQADTYLLEGAAPLYYNCGTNGVMSTYGCSFSTYVADHCFNTNYCWHL